MHKFFTAASGVLGDKEVYVWNHHTLTNPNPIPTTHSMFNSKKPKYLTLPTSSDALEIEDKEAHKGMSRVLVDYTEAYCF